MRISALSMASAASSAKRVASSSSGSSNQFPRPKRYRFTMPFSSSCARSGALISDSSSIIPGRIESGCVSAAFDITGSRFSAPNPVSPSPNSTVP